MKFRFYLEFRCGRFERNLFRCSVGALNDKVVGHEIERHREHAIAVR